MLNLKTIAAAGVTALMLGAAAAPAAAQGYYRHDNGAAYRGGGGYSNLNSSYVDSLEWRINNAAQERRISWGEARQLTRELRQIQGPMIYRIETGRASAWEVRRVNQVVNRIEAATRGYARNDRRDRYGYNRY